MASLQCRTALCRRSVGIESDFGKIMGNCSVVSALATLAYDGRRSSYFRGELISALKIIDQGNIERR